MVTHTEILKSYRNNTHK